MKRGSAARMPRRFPRLALVTDITSFMSTTAPPKTRIIEHRRQKLLELVASVQVLPTSLAVPMRVLEFRRNGGAGMKELAEVICADAGLTAKILSLANSASFTPANTITRLSQALAMIGMKNLMPLVFGLSLAGIFNRLAMAADQRDSLFRASLLKAVTAREIALKLDKEVAEEAFLCGLLQDVALPLLHEADRAAWPETIRLLDLQDQATRLDRELRIYGADHCAIGMAVVKRMNLPAMFQHAVGSHHAGTTPLEVTGNKALATAIDLSSRLPHSAVQLSTGAMAYLSAGLVKTFDSPKTVATLLKTITASYSSTLTLLGHGDENKRFKEFLQDLCGQVAHCMEEAVGESASVITNLRARESVLVTELDGMRQLVAQSEQDVLTGALSRRAFIARATDVLTLARKHQTSCLVGFADLDDFKVINDTLGHAIGDIALKTLSAALTEALRGRGILGRVGGDEFAFIVVCRGGVPDEQHVEKLNSTLGQLSFTTDGGETVAMKSSIGLINIGIPSEQHSIDDFMAWADEVMYEVKRTGKGGCVLRRAA